MEGLLDGAFAFVVDAAALSDGIRNVRHPLFLETKQLHFVDELGVKQINETRMVLSHHKNMGRFAEKFFCEALAAEFPEIESITGDGIDRIAAGLLTLARADSSGLDMDVLAGFLAK